MNLLNLIVSTLLIPAVLSKWTRKWQDCPEEMPNLDRTQLGQLIFIRLIARGQFGCVFLYAREMLDTCELVAVKTKVPDYYDPHIWDTVKRYQSGDEIECLKKVGMYLGEHVDEEKEVWIILKYVPGNHADELYLTEPEDQVEDYVNALWRVLVDLHDHMGIAHGDIKSHNVFFREESHGQMVATLVDYGRCRLLSDHKFPYTLERDLAKAETLTEKLQRLYSAEDQSNLPN